MKTIIVIEDQTMLRDLICEWIEGNTDLKIIAQSGDGAEAYELCMKHKPDIILLDIILPNLNGSELLKRLQSHKLKVDTLIFTALSDQNTISRLLKLGANGIVNKSASLDELASGIRAVAEGKTYYSPVIVETMCRLMREESLDDSQTLTTRELEITQLIANSYTNRQIAEALNTSVRTIDTHRNNIMRKLKLHDAAALTRWAVVNRLIDPFHETLPDTSDTTGSQH